MKYSRKEKLGAIILMIASFIAILLANIKVTRDLYFSFIETQINLRILLLEIHQSILLWVNDALMTIFFLLIGLEVKKALIKGSLASVRQAVLPIIAAIGGMVLPALIYLVFNFQNPISRTGWSIPAVTDVAFSLGVLALLHGHVSESLKIFLMALAIVDDLGAIFIIALFYTKNLSIIPFEIAVMTTVILLILNLCGIRNLFIYILVGMVLWISILEAGIHTTISGVITSFFLPFKEIEKKSPAQTLKDILSPWVIFLILPLFAFVNAGVPLENLMRSATSLLTLGIIIGLLVGKPFGISLFCWLALKLNLARLPHETSYNQIVAISVLCGIGFTMSIFISVLAFSSETSEMIIQAKLGVFSGSLLSAILGYSLLRLKPSLYRRSLTIK